MSKGKFIVIEGDDGVGKSTFAKRLKSELTAAGHPTVYTREPGGTPDGELIRDTMLKLGKERNAESDLLLIMAARSHHVKQIKNWLDEGTNVVCDRWYLSTLRYQVEDNPQLGKLARTIQSTITKELVVDYTVILSADEQTIAKSMIDRGVDPDSLDAISLSKTTPFIQVMDSPLIKPNDIGTLFTGDGFGTHDGLLNRFIIELDL